MEKLTYGHELLMEYKNGRREFSNIRIEVADLTNNDFHDIIIRDSKLNFTLFRVCNLKNAKFINCDIFFGGFRDSDLSNVVFENCKIEFSGFERVIWDKAKILNCQFNWCNMLSTNVNTAEVVNTTFFEVLTDISQLNESYVTKAYENIMPFVQNLDFEIKTQVTKIIDGVAKRLNIEPVNTQISAKYGETKSNHSNVVSYQAINKNIEHMIESYSLKNTYKTKHQYEK